MRDLKAEEIDCRPQSIAKDGTWASLLLYTNARVGMNMLDELYGPTGWQRTHEIIDGQLFCTIEIWDNEKRCWVKKQDVGKNSDIEAEKGRASDAFKRACTNVGIGRSLYSAPHIFINLYADEITTYNNGSIRLKAKVSFAVKSISYKDNIIDSLVIIDNKGTVRYSLNAPDDKVDKTKPTNSDELENALQNIKIATTIEELTKMFNELTMFQSNKTFISALSERKKQLKK